MGNLDGKVAVITGAASGNGRGMAVRFAADGADVVIADRDRDGMEETARRVREHGRRALTRPCDVASKAAIVRAAGPRLVDRQPRHSDARRF